MLAVVALNLSDKAGDREADLKSVDPRFNERACNIVNLEASGVLLYEGAKKQQLPCFWGCRKLMGFYLDPLASESAGDDSAQPDSRTGRRLQAACRIISR